MQKHCVWWSFNMAQLFIHQLLRYSIYCSGESLSMRQLDLAQWANNSVRFLFLSRSLCPSLAHSLSLPASHSTYSSIPYTLSLTVCLCLHTSCSTTLDPLWPSPVQWHTPLIPRTVHSVLYYTPSPSVLYYTTPRSVLYYTTSPVTR